MNEIRKKMPFVSIGVPVYNGESYIGDCLTCLTEQDYPHLEIHIYDNASTDRSGEICQEFTKKDSRVHYHLNEVNIGGVPNFSRAFERSTGDYFMWASHDDKWDKTYISKCMGLFSRSDKLVLVGANTDIINAQTEIPVAHDSGINTIGLSPEQCYQSYKKVLHSGKNYGGIFFGIYKRKFLLQTFPFVNILGFDHLILLKLALLGEFATHEETLFFKREAGASIGYKRMAKGQYITNPIMIYLPMLVREFCLQKIIFEVPTLPFWKKCALSFWSWKNFVQVHVLKASIYHSKVFIKTKLMRSK